MTYEELKQTKEFKSFVQMISQCAENGGQLSYAIGYDGGSCSLIDCLTFDSFEVPDFENGIYIEEDGRVINVCGDKDFWIEYDEIEDEYTIVYGELRYYFSPVSRYKWYKPMKEDIMEPFFYEYFQVVSTTADYEYFCDATFQEAVLAGANFAVVEYNQFCAEDERLSPNSLYLVIDKAHDAIKVQDHPTRPVMVLKESLSTWLTIIKNDREYRRGVVHE